MHFVGRWVIKGLASALTLTWKVDFYRCRFYYAFRLVAAWSGPGLPSADLHVKRVLLE